MRKALPTTIVRLTALVLSASLALPYPAHALRIEAKAEDKGGLEELEQALQPIISAFSIPKAAPVAAGLEEVDRFDRLQNQAAENWKTLLEGRTNPLKIAVVVPSFYGDVERIRKQGSIRLKLTQLQKLLETAGSALVSFTVYVVDDKSQEGLVAEAQTQYAQAPIDRGRIELRTLRLKEAIEAQHPAIKGLTDPTESIKWGSVKLGLHTAVNEGADVVVTTDSDTSQQLTEIPNLLAPILKRGTSAVVGSRFVKGAVTFGTPIHNYLEQFLFNPLVRALFPEIGPVWDIQSGLKAYSAAALIPALPDMQTYKLAGDPELLYLVARNGGRIEEVPRSERDEDPQMTTINAKRYVDFVTQVQQQFGIHKGSAQIPPEAKRFTDAIQAVDIDQWRTQEFRFVSAIAKLQDGADPETVATSLQDLLFAGLEEDIPSWARGSFTEQVFSSWRRLAKQIDHRQYPVWSFEGKAVGFPRIIDIARETSSSSENVRQRLGLISRRRFFYRPSPGYDGPPVDNYLPVRREWYPGAENTLSSWIAKYNEHHLDTPINYSGKDLHLTYQAVVQALQSGDSNPAQRLVEMMSYGDVLSDEVESRISALNKLFDFVGGIPAIPIVIPKTAAGLEEDGLKSDGESWGVAWNWLGEIGYPRVILFQDYEAMEIERRLSPAGAREAMRDAGYIMQPNSSAWIKTAAGPATKPSEAGLEEKLEIFKSLERARQVDISVPYERQKKFNKFTPESFRFYTELLAGRDIPHFLENDPDQILLLAQTMQGIWVGRSPFPDRGHRTTSLLAVFPAGIWDTQFIAALLKPRRIGSRWSNQYEVADSFVKFRVVEGQLQIGMSDLTPELLAHYARPFLRMVSLVALLPPTDSLTTTLNLSTNEAVQAQGLLRSVDRESLESKGNRSVVLTPIENDAMVLYRSFVTPDSRNSLLEHPLHFHIGQADLEKVSALLGKEAITQEGATYRVVFPGRPPVGIRTYVTNYGDDPALTIEFEETTPDQEWNIIETASRLGALFAKQEFNFLPEYAGRVIARANAMMDLSQGLQFFWEKLGHTDSFREFLYVMFFTQDGQGELLLNATNLADYSHRTYRQILQDAEIPLEAAIQFLMTADELGLREENDEETLFNWFYELFFYLRSLFGSGRNPMLAQKIFQLGQTDNWKSVEFSMNGVPAPHPVISLSEEQGEAIVDSAVRLIGWSDSSEESAGGLEEDASSKDRFKSSNIAFDRLMAQAREQGIEAFEIYEGPDESRPATLAPKVPGSPLTDPDASLGLEREMRRIFGDEVDRQTYYLRIGAKEGWGGLWAEVVANAGLEEFKMVPLTHEYALAHALQLLAVETGEPVWDKEGHWDVARYYSDTRPQTGTFLNNLWELSFAAEDSQGIPAAYIYTTHGQPDYPVTAEYPGVFIFRLSVRPDAQGNKLGQRLLLQSATAAREAGFGPWMTLETDRENIRAQHVYESLGFENKGERFDEKKGITFVSYAVKISTLIERAEKTLRRSTGLEEGIQAFRKMLEDPDWKFHFASPGFVALDTERKAALDIPAEATAFIVSDEAAISTEGHRIYADNRLTHAERDLLIWTPVGTGAQEVVQYAKQKGAKQGDLLLIPPDAGVDIDQVEALLRQAGYLPDLSDAPRVVIADQAQVEATALSTLWFLASHAELPRVVFLSVEMKLTDEAGNTYTLIVMA